MSWIHFFKKRRAEAPPPEPGDGSGRHFGDFWHFNTFHFNARHFG